MKQPVDAEGPTGSVPRTGMGDEVSSSVAALRRAVAAAATDGEDTDQLGRLVAALGALETAVNPRGGPSQGAVGTADASATGDWTVWKFVLAMDAGAVASVDMPASAEILTLQLQYDKPCLWARVDPSEEAVRTRWFRFVGTGEAIHGQHGTYVGTIQLHGGAAVGHVFELDGWP